MEIVKLCPPTSTFGFCHPNDCRQFGYLGKSLKTGLRIRVHDSKLIRSTYLQCKFHILMDEICRIKLPQENYNPWEPDGTFQLVGWMGASLDEHAHCHPASSLRWKPAVRMRTRNGRLLHLGRWICGGAIRWLGGDLEPGLGLLRSCVHAERTPPRYK